MARRTWWKVGALLAAMMMFLTMLPATALAADGDTVYVGGVTLSGSTDSPAYATTDDSGNVSTASATAANYNIKWDGSTLTLRNATIKESVSTDTSTFIAGAAIGVLNQNGDANLTITLEGTNTIAEVSMGIYVLASSNSTGSASLTITGDGILSASSGSNPGIRVQSNTGNGTLTITGAKVTASSSNGGNGVQIRCGDGSDASLTVNDGSLTATGSGTYGAGIRFQFGSSDSSSRTPSLTVSGNAMVKASGDTGGITSNSSTVTPSGTGIVFDNGAGTVYGSVTLQEDLTIGEGESLTIPDGANLNTDGKLTVDGGTLTQNGTVTGDIIYKVTGVSLSTDSLTLEEGGTANLTATITPANATNQNVTWSSDNTNVATVSGGVVTAESAGAATITATAADGSGEKATCSVTVNATANVPVESVSLDKSSLELTEGSSDTLTATITPNDASNKSVTWSSNDESVATVNNGVVTAVSSGTATITVTAQSNDTKSATCTVTVTAATVPVTGVTLSQSQARLYYNGTPNTFTLAATVVPDNATSKAVTWTSSNSAVATVDGSGNVTAVAPGTATITVTTADGGKTAACLVTVTGVYIPPRPTGPDWGDVADDISDAEPGSTVEVDMDGKTLLPGEVLDELAGRDVTLALDMGDGLFWEIYGGDVPKSEGYDDVDLGVALGGDDIPADVVNLVTGESGFVQVSLEHDGPFSFELTLVAPLGEDAAGLVANLYRYDDEAGSLGYEATAQVDGEGVARLPFDHASSWLVALDSRTHALPFADAPEGEWYSEAIRWAWLGGAMTGYEGTGLFGTGDPLTRAQLAQMLYNRAGAPEVEPADGFADVDDADWFAPAVAWASSEGLLTGYGDGAFGPDDALTREQLAVVFWRIAGEPAAEADLSRFPDGAETSAWAVGAMQWAVSTGLFEGYTDTGRLDPAGDLTRAQAATVFFRQAEAATE